MINFGILEKELQVKMKFYREINAIELCPIRQRALKFESPYAQGFEVGFLNADLVTSGPENIDFVMGASMGAALKNVAIPFNRPLVETRKTKGGILLCQETS